MNRVAFLLGVGLLAAGLRVSHAAGGYEAQAAFENLWHLPPLAPGHANPTAGVAFGGHAGPYRLPGSEATPALPSTPDGRYRLAQSAFGQPFEGRRPDFQLGQVITAPPGVAVDVSPVIDPPTAAFYAPSRQFVIAADSGLVRIRWPLLGGGTQERIYLISAVPERRPARIFWTEEPHNAPTVSLRDRFTLIHYNSVITPPTEDTSKTNQPLKQYSRGLWEDEQHILHAKDVTGMVILEYFETGERLRQVGWEVVEVAAPRVNVQRVAVGQRLMPLDAYYGGADLRADIRKGLPKLVYKHATRTPDGPKNEWVFAIARTVDQPYLIEMYWKHQGLMEVEWPFELDWYAADWPPDDLAQVYVRGGASSNAPVVISRDLQVKLEDFQEPAQHATLSNNAAGEWVFATSRPGHALLRYAANENVWFEVIRSVDHADPDLFNGTPLPWTIGNELTPTRVVNALQLNGSNALRVPLGAQAAITFEGWIRPDHNQKVSLLTQHAAADPAHRSLQLELNANHHLQATVWAEGSRQSIVLEGRTSIATGLWQHVALTLATNGPVRLFVNGVEDADPAVVGALGGDVVTLGSAAGGGTLAGYSGQLADWRIWTRLVSPGELAAQRELRLVGQPAGLAFHLNFESWTSAAVGNRVGGELIPVQGLFAVNPIAFGDVDAEWTRHPGYVHPAEGDRYNDRLYTYPSASSRLFPVNTGVLEVWWSQERRQEGMPVGVVWPSWVVRYAGEWDPAAPVLVLAGQNNNPVGELGSAVDQPSIYYQNDPTRPGYNPNEEHALIISGKVYALRDDLNQAQSSQPYVLVQYTESPSGRPRMTSFRVVETNAVYTFTQDLEAGLLLQPPMPLTVLPKAAASYVVSGPAWRDRKLEHWAIAAGADGISPTNIVLRFFYPVQPSFSFPGEPDPPAPGTEVPWLSRNGPRGNPIDYRYAVRWPEDVPVLRVGETLSKAKRKMPAIRGQKSVSIIYQQSDQLHPGTPTVTLIDPTQERSVPLDALPDDLATETHRGKKYFPSLPPHLRNRLFFDPDAKRLKLIGEFVEPPAGEAFLELNLLNDTDRETVRALSADSGWQEAIDRLALGVVTIPDENTPFDSLALSAGLGRGVGYVTVVFNNSTRLNEPPDPISIAILRVDGPLYRGEIKVVLSDNPLDEKLTLQHSGDFAGDPSQYEFEWRRESPDDSGMPPDTDPSEWILHSAAANQPRVVLGGPGLLTLTDTYWICRYRPKAPSGPTGAAWSAWTDPMLAEGWIKRALNGINPFEQRISDLQDNAVNTTVDMVSQAGPRWAGDIPLNLENINDYGLIEIYETVLKRGRELSIESGYRYGPANDALLLAAGRIHDLYMILGNEAYADANDPTIAFSTSDRAVYGSEWTSLFCFMNQLPTLLEEELALLRGRDDALLPSVHTDPIYNRLIWNFTKGLNGGEVAYALNYNVRNQDGDDRGSINEADAKKLYPQGHGDAWGHYLTAIKGYYHLLANTNFDWVPRIESKLVGGVPVSVDYYDERKFAEAAAARARTGIQLMGLTHRQLYQEAPAGVWSGFRDSRPERAWGLAEWGSRIGQAALFDWAVANSLLPNQDTNAQHVGIQIIDRTTVPELKEIVTAIEEVQKEMDYADKGLNPLGLDKNAVPFDIDPAEIDAGKTHFEQLYDRALAMVENATRLLANAQDKVQLLRRQADSLEGLRESIGSGEDDYNNQLIEIFGYPYPDDIGPGKTYPQGYDGPDLYHYQYVDVADLLGDRLPVKGTNLLVQVYNYEFTSSDQSASFWQELAGVKVRPLNLQLNTNSVVSLPFYVTDQGLVVKPPEWTSTRRARGEVQMAYSDFLLAWYDLQTTLRDYNALLGDIVDAFGLLDARVEQYATENSASTTYGYIIAAAEVTSRIANSIADDIKETRDLLLTAMSVPKEAIPESFIAGLAAGGDVMAPARGAIKAAESGASASFSAIEKIMKGMAIAAEITQAVTQGMLDGKLRGLEQDADLLELRLALQQTLRQQQARQMEIQGQLERLVQAQERYRGALVKGERLIAERTGFRAQAATAIQGDRYADMAFRLFRNDALGRYRAAFDLAGRYVYLAAKAYAYETGMRLGEAGSPSAFLEDIVNARSLGVLNDGRPLSGGALGDPGLSDVLARLKANWDVLDGRLGFNNPARETSRLSLRAELFRVGSPSDPAALATSDTTWRNTLWRYKVDNLLEVPEFRRYCLPFAPLAEHEPALVIPFATTIEAKKNLFGWDLAGGDHAYDSSHFATKIRAVGVWFSNFNAAFGGGLGFTPRVYLIPVGDDLQREPGDALAQPRVWRVVDQALPVPYDLETGTLDDPDWLPIIDGLTEGFAAIRKYPSIRAYHDQGDFDPAEVTSNARLVGRSVWNTRWLLIIPASTLHSDTEHALEWFINGIQGDGNGVKDIKLLFQTYSFSGN